MTRHQHSILAAALQLLLLCGHFTKSTIAKPHERHCQNEHLISTSRRTYEDDKYFSIDDNLYIKESNHMYAHGGVASGSTSFASASVSGSRQESIWNTIQNLDNDYKVPPFYETINGSKTLTKVKYMVLPIWWSDEDTSNKFDLTPIRNNFDSVVQYYRDMSYNKFELSYQIVPQTVFPVSSVNPSWGNTDEDACVKILRNMGYEQGIDYDSIALVYNVAQSGPFSGGGGWGGVNSRMQWNSYPTYISVLRHEIGHNFGHPHHVSNSYNYRFTKPQMLEGGDEYAAPYDGWDMMSGGNDVDDDMNPHFAAASKWFYNWIPDESIIHMQPEGSTSQCPDCISSGTFTLHSFDDPNLSPTANRKMGIHIPIAVTDNGETLYSYWLSYRGTGYAGAAANGLSVHLTWFYLEGTNYGSWYDSLNYDAFGDTETTNDSFVENGSCYHIFPSAYMSDRAEESVNAVQPVVCVNSIDVGNSITVTVEFLDTSSPPNQQISTVDRTVKCGNTAEASVIALDSSKNSLVKVEGTGDISTSMCASSGSFSGYYYDQFPYSPLTYSSNLAYGSYLRQASSSTCSSSSYRAVNDETFILVPASNFSGGRMEISCVKPPEDQFEERAPSKGWRLWADRSHTTSGWTWDISLIQFYTSVDCSGSAIANDGTPVHSSSYDLIYWGPQNAFKNSGAWGGRTDENGEFYIGMVFSTTKDIKCIKLKHFGNNLANEVRVQAQNASSGEWENAYIAKDLVVENVIEMRYGDTSSPVASPVTNSPVASPVTNSPVAAPVSPPVSSPTFNEDEFEEQAPSKGWRLWADKSHTTSGWAWDISLIQFYTSVDCSGSAIANDGTPIHSGSYDLQGWGPQNAFTNSGAWGGRTDENGEFYIGMVFSTTKDIKCIKLKHSGDKLANEVRVQAQNASSGEWENAYIAKDLVFENVIEMRYDVLDDDGSCEDFPDGIKWNKKGTIRKCSWIEGNPSTRCKKKKAKALCPNVCGTTSSWCGSNLADAKGMFQITPTSTKYKGCAWVKRDPAKIENRCKKGNIALACRLTCKDYV